MKSVGKVVIDREKKVRLILLPFKIHGSLIKKSTIMTWPIRAKNKWKTRN